MLVGRKKTCRDVGREKKPAGMLVVRTEEVEGEGHLRGTPSYQAIHCGSWVRFLKDKN